MKRKLLFTLALVALAVMLLAISVSADDIVITANDIESASATATKLKDPITLFDDVVETKGGWYSSGWNGWTGPGGSVATIVFKEEFVIKSAYLYVWTNHCPGARFAFIDSSGKETYSVLMGNEQGGLAGCTDGAAVPIPLPEDKVVKVKTLTITIQNGVKYDGYGFSIGELDLYAEHSCVFTIPGDVLLKETCAMDGEQQMFCRCGKDDIAYIPATGEHGEATQVVYRRGFNKPGKLAKVCPTCATKDELIEEVPPMLTSIGYSVSEFGKNGVTQGVLINRDAVNKYNEYAAAPIDFGMVAGARSALVEGNPLLIAGDSVTKASNVVAYKSFANETSTLISYSLNGFGDMYKDTQLIVSAYVYDGNDIYYLSGDSISTVVQTVSYNDVLNISAPAPIEVVIKEN